jgi:ABC-type transport system involved in multi-copper enzyme maturation permease subunit
MLKKECRDILIQSFFFAVALVALPAVIVLTRIIPKQPYVAIFMPVFQSGMLFWALFMGVSLFSSERGQKGMEYLLSLPYSRLKLLAIKVLPRFLSILFFYLVFLILYYHGGRDFVALALFSLSFLYFVLFFISLSLSALSDNFLVISLVSLFALVVFNEIFFLILWLLMRAEGISDYSWSEISSTFLSLQWEGESWLPFPVLILAAIFLLFPLGLAMLFSFRRFDVRPSKIYGRRYFKFLAPLLIVGILCAALTVWIGIDRGPKYFYLTQDHKLIESTYLYTKIYDQNNVSKLSVHFFPYSFWDNPPYLYYYDWENGLVRLNTATATSETIYSEPKIPRKRYWDYYRRFKYGNTLALFEPGRTGDELLLVQIDAITKDVTKISFKHDFFKNSSAPVILDTGIREGKRFWLVFFQWTANHPLRLWEDGHVDNLEVKAELLDQNSAEYANGLLFLSNADFTLVLKETDNTFAVVKKIAKGYKAWHWVGLWPYFSDIGNDMRIKEIYGQDQARLVRIDLETLEIEDLGEWKRSEDGNWRVLRFIPPHEFYYVEENGRDRTIKIFGLEGRQKTLLKTFENFDFRQNKYQIEISKGGIVIQRRKKVQVYSLPDFQEIKYKKLG